MSEGLKIAALEFRARHDRSPATLADLLDEPMGPSQVRVARDWLRDGWGELFEFKVLSASSFEIRSPGPDRRRGSSDDIVLRYP